MADKRQRRLEKRSKAIGALQTNSGPVLNLLGEVIHDLSEEVEGLRQFEQDMAFAAELGWRLDNAVKFKDPLFEFLDGIVTFFVALAAIGIWRAAARQDKLRNAKIDRIQTKLRNRGPKMALGMQTRLERRLRRLKRRAARSAG
jgi:hypothetical protein